MRTVLRNVLSVSALGALALMAPLQALGLEPEVVDAAPLALTNALIQQVPDKRDAGLLLDLGHRSSHLTFHQRGEPYFSRRIEFGGRNISQAIARATRVPFEEAEEWKLAAGSGCGPGKG